MAPPPWGWSPKIFNPVAIRLFLRKRAPAAPPGTPRQPRPLSPARLGRVTLPSDVGRPDRSCPPALRARRDHRHRWVFGNAFARLPFLSSSVVLFPRRPRQPGARHPAPVQSTGQRSCGASYLSSFSVPTVTAGRPTFLLFPVSGTTHILCNSAAFGTSPSPSTPIDSSDAANAARG